MISGWQRSEFHISVLCCLSLAALPPLSWCMTTALNCKPYNAYFSSWKFCPAHQMGCSAILLPLSTGIPPKTWAICAALGMSCHLHQPCCKMGMIPLPQRGWGLAQPPPYVAMAPTKWLTRRDRGGRAFMPSDYREQYSTVVICWSPLQAASSLPCVPLRTSALLKARAVSYETLL